MFLKLYSLPLSVGMKIKIKAKAQLNYGGKPLRIRIGTSDVLVFESVFLNEEYDLSFLNLYPKIILDLGANVGYTSIFFANCYPGSRILSVEPEENNFKMLKENTRPYQNIVPIHAAVWYKNQRLQIKNPKAEKWEFQVGEVKDETCSVMVNALTMDDLIKITGKNTIDILKIDIEGAEVEVCGSNCESWLGKINVIVIELHDSLRKGCSDIFKRAVSHYDFQRVQRGEHTILFKTAKSMSHERSN
jgi:FkbM family methyltransferase